MATFQKRSFTSRGTTVGDLKAQMGKIEQNFRAVIEGLTEAAGEATEDIANAILERSNELVPVLTSELQKSGRVFTSKSGEGNKRAGVTYGNEKVNYAVFVHEDMSKNHPNGQAKFLEQAMNELTAWERRYQHYVEFDRICEAIKEMQLRLRA